MKLRARRLARAVPAWILVILLIFSLTPASRAAEGTPTFEGEIELTGKFNGRFTLDSSDMHLFTLENMAPGDSWRGKIHVKNSASAQMEIAILSIVSNLEDKALFDALKLKIQMGDTEIYDGSYGGTTDPISTFYKIPAGRTVTFDITVTFPKECGNELQNAEMNSTWTFEGRYYGGYDDDDPPKPPITIIIPDPEPEPEPEPGPGPEPEPEPPVIIQTGVDVTASSSQNATWLFVSLLCVASCILMLFRIRAAKKGTTETKKKGRE